jgi:hypothetical protein
MARMRVVVGSLVAAVTLVLAGCSSRSSDHADARPEGDSDVVVTTTTVAEVTGSDSTALCAIFNRLAANGGGRDAQFDATAPDGWAQRIATTAEMAAVAPPEWRDEAETYHQMMRDRAQLAAENGYVGVHELPADVRNAFISAHAAMQADVNRLIAYMGQECGNRTG